MKTLVRAESGKSRSVEHDAYLRGRQYASHLLIEMWVIFGSRVRSFEAGAASHRNASQVPGDIAVYSNCGFCSTVGPDLGGQRSTR